jgi:GNAT superfamily N-acetyltransferase
VATDDPARIVVRQLRSDDDRSGFRSGNVDLDRFFEKYAGQNQFRHHIGTTYVAVDGDQIVGFATVSPSEIDVERISAARRKRLPRYPMPVLRLARLAVDERAQGRGVGHVLLKAVFVLAKELAADYGCVGVVVDAKPEAVSFYERYGFVGFPTVSGALGDRPEPRPMFLDLGAIPKS